MRKNGQRQVKVSILRTAMIALVLTGLATSVVVNNYRSRGNTDASTNQHRTITNSSLTAQTTALRTYSSTIEQASFQYPGDWKVSKSSGSSNIPNADIFSITSPSGAITISWISAITGFGNEFGTSYPLNSIVSKTPVPSAPGIFVVDGTTTLDGSTYHPWIAVQDANGVVKNGVGGDLVTFAGRHNKNPGTKHGADALFSTSGPRAHEGSPALTLNQAQAWFSSTDAQQAQQILLSFNDKQ